jgi:hypothetical protein
MRRRDLLIGLGSASLITPGAVEGQTTTRSAQIGILNATPRTAPPLQAFFAEREPDPGGATKKGDRGPQGTFL